MSESVKVFCMVEVFGTSDPKQAVEEMKDALEGDNVIVFHNSVGRENVGVVGQRVLEGIAKEFNRTFVIRMNDQFFPYIEDYPMRESQPYPLTIRVTEVVGIYNERTIG